MNLVLETYVSNMKLSGRALLRKNIGRSSFSPSPCHANFCANVNLSCFKDAKKVKARNYFWSDNLVSWTSMKLITLLSYWIYCIAWRVWDVRTTECVSGADKFLSVPLLICITISDKNSSNICLATAPVCKLFGINSAEKVT